MPSGEFQRIVKDLGTIGDTGAGPLGANIASGCTRETRRLLCHLPSLYPACKAHFRPQLPAPCLCPAPPRAAVEIGVSKDGVKFSASGDIGSANIMCRQNTHADKDVRTGGQGSWRGAVQLTKAALLPQFMPCHLLPNTTAAGAG